MKIRTVILLYTFPLLFCGTHAMAQKAPENGDTAAPQLAMEKTPEGSDSLAAAAPPLRGDAAAQAYRNQDYQQSIELYEAAVAKALQEQKASAQLYYNLGNAYFRDNRLAKAILNYERALRLDPSDRDIRHNLRYANNRTEDRIESLGTLFLTRWISSLRHRFSSNTWATVAVVLFILFLASVALYLFVRLLWVRKAAFYTGLLLLFLLVMANLFAFQQKREFLSGGEAIVMVGAARVNASPDENSNQLFELHEGTKVKIRNRDGNWYEIEIANGSVGWTSRENVEVI